MRSRPFQTRGHDLNRSSKRNFQENVEMVGGDWILCQCFVLLVVSEFVPLTQVGEMRPLPIPYSQVTKKWM